MAISTPAATHVTLTQQALRLGLAVVCDKPFALDAESARATVELAEELKLPLTVYQNRRWDSDFLTLRELLDKGALGTLTAFESRFERFRPRVQSARGGRRDPAGLRQPPGRPGPGPGRPGQRRVRRDTSPHRRGRAR